MKFDKDKLHPADGQIGAVLTRPAWEQDAAMCTQVCKPRVLKSSASHLCGSKGFVHICDVSEGKVGCRQPFCAPLLVSLLQSCKMEVQEPRRGSGGCWTSVEDSAVLLHSLGEHPSPQPASSGSVRAARMGPLCKCFCKESHGIMFKYF